MHVSAAGLSIEPALAPVAHDVLPEALEGERCVILDGSEQIGAARTAPARKPRGAPRPGAGGPHELGGAHAAPPEPWVDAAGRSVYALACPD